ncbi:MAG: DUF1302 domain-containing protein, partial [Proteobacteria bacterium]|nr:DUF1302 domain-containing protein [Pseudomonadota bacterium]
LIFTFVLVGALAFNMVVVPTAKAASERTTSNETLEESDDDSLEGFEDDDDSLEGFEDDDDSLEGFEDEGEIEDVSIDVKSLTITPMEPSFFSFGGFIREDIAYSYQRDDPDLSRIRSTLNLNADVKLFADWKIKMVWNGFFDYAYSRIGRDRFTDETLDTYESDSEIRDFFIDGSIFDWLRFKVGRQIIAWGESESTQITDMANPRDMTELGMVDIEDARIPVTATKFSILYDAWEVNLVAIGEIRPNKIPAEGSEFDMFQPLRTLPIIEIEDEETPKSEAHNTEVLFRLFKSFNGGDVSFVWADVYDDFPHLDFNGLELEALPPQSPVRFSPKLRLIPRHKRIKTLGFSGNKASGSWLFKAELARQMGKALARDDFLTQLEDAQNTLLLGKRFFSSDTELIKTWSEKDLLHLMAGFEYSGMDDLSIGLEAFAEKIEDYQDYLMDRETGGSISLILTYTALNDTLNARLFWLRFSRGEGDVVRVNVDYDIVDALNVSGGFIVYEATDEESTLHLYKNNDRVFAALKYSF